MGAGEGGGVRRRGGGGWLMARGRRVCANAVRGEMVTRLFAALRVGRRVLQLHELKAGQKPAGG